VATRIAISSGSPKPLGVTPLDVGVNVAVVSKHADRIDFCVFDEKDIEIARLALPTREGDVHCGFVAGAGAGTRYGLRADGPYEPTSGNWFDPAKLLVDPYAQSLDRPFAYHGALAAPRESEIDTASLVPKAVVTMRPLPPRASGPRKSGFIYEIAVKAFSKRNAAIPEALRGTVAALGHPATIDHLVKLGVDTVELMPLAAWIDERHLPPLGLTNAWGYNPVIFMAPDPRIAPGGIAEISDAVSALHAAGIGVILDGVFNHTGESDAFGPTLSLRGLDNALYYRHASDDPGRLANDTGTGNALAADRPEVMVLILDAMRYWATVTGIDGFRLDLAVSLGRADDGFRRDAPIFRAIEADPLLGSLTVIAEPWDVGLGGYQLGKLPPRWSEWNDRYRDDVRLFWRGDRGRLGSLATRLAGSADIFAGRRPSASVNFLAAHDGFSLADLVAHERKHNLANGENNRDGTDANFSWNDGVEGPTDDAAILAARRNDARALLATLFVSRGTLMLTAGDEFGRTQGGNNNAYAQDNPTTWLDWENADMELAGFVSRLSALRKRHRSLSDDDFLTGRPTGRRPVPDAVWLRPDGGEMTLSDWDAGGRTVGLLRFVPETETGPEDRTIVWINGEPAPLRARLPEPRKGRVWQAVADSGRPKAILPQIQRDTWLALPPRSVILLAETVEAGPSSS
jgi:glycogen operon protein